MIAAVSWPSMCSSGPIQAPENPSGRPPVELSSAAQPELQGTKLTWAAVGRRWAGGLWRSLSLSPGGDTLVEPHTKHLRQKTSQKHLRKPVEPSRVCRWVL